MSQKLSEVLSVASTLTPFLGTSARNSLGIDMTKFTHAMFVFTAGVIDATGTVDFKLQESIDNSTFANITGKAATQLAATDDHKGVIINIRADELTDGYRYVRGVSTTATADATTQMTAVAWVAQGVASGLDVADATAPNNNIVEII